MQPRYLAYAHKGAAGEPGYTTRHGPRAPTHAGVRPSLRAELGGAAFTQHFRPSCTQHFRPQHFLSLAQVDDDAAVPDGQDLVLLTFGRQAKQLTQALLASALATYRLRLA